MLIDETLTTADIKWSQMDVCTRLSYRKESRFIEMNMPEHVQNFIKQYVRNWVCQAPNVGMFPVWWDKSLLHCQFVRISFNKKLRGTSRTHFISINSSNASLLYWHTLRDFMVHSGASLKLWMLQCFEHWRCSDRDMVPSWCTSLTQKSIIKWPRG